MLIVHIHFVMKGKIKCINVILNSELDFFVISEPDHFKICIHPFVQNYAFEKRLQYNAHAVHQILYQIPDDFWFILKLKYCNGIPTILWIVNSGQLSRIQNNKTFWLLSPSI